MSSDHKLSSTRQLWNSLWFDPEDCSDLEQLEKMSSLIAWGNDKWATLSKDKSYSSYVLLLRQTQEQINDHFLRLQMEKGNVEEWQMGIALYAVHILHRNGAEVDSFVLSTTSTERSSQIPLSSPTSNTRVMVTPPQVKRKTTPTPRNHASGVSVVGDELKRHKQRAYKTHSTKILKKRT